MIFKVIKYMMFISYISNDTYVDCSSKIKYRDIQNAWNVMCGEKFNNLNFSLISIFEVYNAAKNYYSRIVTIIKLHI